MVVIVVPMAKIDTARVACSVLKPLPVAKGLMNRLITPGKPLIMQIMTSIYSTGDRRAFLMLTPRTTLLLVWTAAFLSSVHPQGRIPLDSGVGIAKSTVHTTPTAMPSRAMKRRAGRQPQASIRP